MSKENFDPWQIQVKALLTKNDTWGYVCRDIRAPVAVAEDASSEVAINAWKSVDKKAKSDIILSISPSKLKIIKGCITSRNVWLKLESIHAAQGPARKATLLKQLTLHRIKKGEDVRHHMGCFFDSVNKL